MKRTFKKAAACALALTLVFGASAANVSAGGFDGVVISASAETTTTSGSWNQPATPSFIPSENTDVIYSYSSGSGNWDLSSDHKTLTLTGEGSTKAFGSEASTDWQQWRGEVETIEVGNGITELNARCFYNFSKLKSVTLPSSLTTIGYAAFLGCESLESITLPASVKYVHYAAFSKGNANFEITLSGADQKIKNLDKAFVTDSSGDEKSNLDDIAVINGVTLSNETIDYYLNMFPNAEVGGTIRITPLMQLSADGSRFTIKGYVPLTTKRTVDKYTVTLGSTTPSLTETETESGSQGTFTVACAAKEMADVKPITISVNRKQGYCNDHFTVKSYLSQDAILNSDIYGAPAKSMLRYGAAAQMYFGYNTENLANKGVSGAEIASVTNAPSCSYSFTKDAMNTALSTAMSNYNTYFSGYTGINMTFTADTTLMLGFKYSETDLTNKDAANKALESAFEANLTQGCGVTRDDVTVETDDSGKYAVVRVKNVPLMKLDTPIFTISTGDGDVKVCATQYLVQAANSNGTSTELKNLCKALYAFYSDAKSVNAASGN